MRIVLLLLALSFLLFAKPLLLLFSGNEKLTSRELYDTLGLKLPYAIEVWENQPVMDEIMVSQGVSALVSYYRSKGYFETKITPTITATDITLEIVENKPVIVSNVQVNSVLDVDQMVELDKDDLFDQDKFSSSKIKIKKRYHDAGYCNATFNSKSWVDLETHEAYVLFEATPNDKCFFGTIAVKSTPNIDGNLTKSMLHFDEGDPYSLEAIQKSYEALYAQEAISRVSINNVDRIGDTVPITLSIEEVEKPIRLSSGLGYSTDQGFGAQIGIKHRNILGDMKTLSLDGKFTQIKQETAAVLSVPLYDHFFAYGEVGYWDEIFDGYRSQSIFEKITLKHQDIPTSYLISMLFDKVKTYESVNTVAFQNSTLFIPSPMIEFDIDTRDKLLEPTRGNWMNVRGQGSIYSGISDATYFKTLLSGAHIQSIWEDHIIAARVKWGTLRVYDGRIPSAYRFYAGGMNSNRAYGYRELGSQDFNGDPLGFDALLEGTLEYRFGVYDDFRGVLFGDLTYGGDNYLPDYTQPYLGVGVGIRYVTPIGPLAIDIGVDPSDMSQHALHFHIGELF